MIGGHGMSSFTRHQPFRPEKQLFLTRSRWRPQLSLSLSSKYHPSNPSRIPFVTATVSSNLISISLNGRPNTHRPATQRTCRLCRLARRWDTLRSRCERFAGSAGCSVGATATVTAFRPSEDGRAAARRLSRRCQSLRGWANWLRQPGRDFSQNWRSRALNCAKFEKNLHQRTFFKILG